MLEKTLEAYLRNKIIAAGGLFLKWVCPGMSGACDRIAIFPGGVVIFVEMKIKGGRLSPEQKVVHRRLLDRGCEVYVIWNKEQADKFLDECIKPF